MDFLQNSIRANLSQYQNWVRQRKLMQLRRSSHHSHMQLVYHPDFLHDMIHP